MHKRWFSVAIAAVIGLAVSAEKAAAVGLSDIANIFSGGGDFLDFSTVFVDSSWDNPVADIVSGTISTDGGWSGSGDSNAVFDDAFDKIAGDLGIPSEVKDIISGKNPADYLSVVLDDVLGDIGLANINLDDVLGSNGLPIPEDISQILTSETLNAQESIYGQTADIPVIEETPLTAATPNVNPALISSVQALSGLTNAIAGAGLSEEGQQIATARAEAANTVVYGASQLGANSTAVAEEQLEAAQELDETVRAQTSTQDAIKEALTGLTLLTAQSTQQVAYANEQAALDSQMQSMQIALQTEGNNAAYAGALGIQELNEQMLRDTQMKLATESSSRHELLLGVRTLGPMR